MLKRTLPGRLRFAVFAMVVLGCPFAARAAEDAVTLERTAASGKDFCDLIAADFRMKPKDGAWVSRWATIITVQDWWVSSEGTAVGTDYRTTRQMFTGRVMQAEENGQTVERMRCALDKDKTAVTYGLHVCTLSGPVAFSVAGLFPGGKAPKADMASYILPKGARVTLHMGYTFPQPNGDPAYQPAYCSAE